MKNLIHRRTILKFLQLCCLSLIFVSVCSQKGSAEQAALYIDGNGKYPIAGLNLYYGSPADILVIQCATSCSKLIPYFNRDISFEHGTLIFNGESLSLEDIRIFSIQRVYKKMEVVFHITHINPTGAQRGIDM